MTHCIGVWTLNFPQVHHSEHWWASTAPWLYWGKLTLEVQSPEWWTASTSPQSNPISLSFLPTSLTWLCTKTNVERGPEKTTFSTQAAPRKPLSSVLTRAQRANPLANLHFLEAQPCCVSARQRCAPLECQLTPLSETEGKDCECEVRVFNAQALGNFLFTDT